MELKVGDIVRIDGDYFSKECRGHIGKILKKNRYDYIGRFNGLEQCIGIVDLESGKLVDYGGKVAKLKPNKLNQKLYPEIKEFI